jgi:hypothetical protein
MTSKENKILTREANQNLKIIDKKLEKTLSLFKKDVTFGLELNWFFHGDTFVESNNDTANQIVGYVFVTF